MIDYTPYKLLDWIDPKRLDPENLSLNPRATNFLDTNSDKIVWAILTANENAILLLEQNIEKIRRIDWFHLSENPNALPLLEKNIEKIDWISLSINPQAIYLLEKYPDKIDWTQLIEKSTGIHLLEKYPDKIIGGIYP